MHRNQSEVLGKPQIALLFLSDVTIYGPEKYAKCGVENFRRLWYIVIRNAGYVTGFGRTNCIITPPKKRDRQMPLWHLPVLC